MSDVALPSHDGPVVRADRSAFESALAGAHWHSVEDLTGSLTNGPGPHSWPIVGASYVLVRASSGEVAQVDAFFDWALTSGSGIANDLGYVALPADVVALVQQAMR